MDQSTLPVGLTAHLSFLVGAAGRRHLGLDLIAQSKPNPQQQLSEASFLLREGGNTVLPKKG